MKLDLAPYTEHVSNEPYGLPGTREELTVTGAYLATLEAVQSREPFSIVRMSDGETSILDYCDEHAYGEPMLRYDDNWNLRYGVRGITCGEIKRRLLQAAVECTYLAQDGWIPYCINGVRRFIHRQPFIWPRFPDVWTRKQWRLLYSAAGRLLVINRDEAMAEKTADGYPYDYVTLSDWTQADMVIDAASRSAPRLVLVSCGPGSKHVCPEIAKQGKVVLDIGSAPERWWTREQCETS